MVPEQPDWGALTGTATAAVGGVWVLDPPDLLPLFLVLSGPCTVAEGGRCVGRWPGGYLPNEDCEIVVTGAGGALGPCPVFDINYSTMGPDCLTLPDGSQHHAVDCPVSGRAAVCPAGAILVTARP
jgi:hypothetical protein